MILTITPEGQAKAIYNDDFADALRGLGKVSVERASHVEPVDGSTEWQADMSPVGGPMLPKTATRQESLDLEVAWLNEHMDDIR